MLSSAARWLTDGNAVASQEEFNRFVALGHNRISVARLVAELHRGTATASNLADGSGVEFCIGLRSLSRRRLADYG